MHSLKKFNVSDFLKTADDIENYLEEAWLEGTADELNEAVNDVAAALKRPRAEIQVRVTSVNTIQVLVQKPIRVIVDGQVVDRCDWVLLADALATPA